MMTMQQMIEAAKSLTKAERIVVSETIIESGSLAEALYAHCDGTIDLDEEGTMFTFDDGSVAILKLPDEVAVFMSRAECPC